MTLRCGFQLTLGTGPGALRGSWGPVKATHGTHSAVRWAPGRRSLLFLPVVAVVLAASTCLMACGDWMESGPLEAHHTRPHPFDSHLLSLG